VDWSAKDVGSSDERGVGIGDWDHHFGDGRGAPLLEGPVRPVPVVMIHVLDEDSFEMVPAEDEEPVQAFTADGADKPLADRVRAWRHDGRLDDPDPVGCEEASKEEVNLVSRSRMRNLTGVVGSVSS